VLGDIEPHHVAVMPFIFFSGENTSMMQILCIASQDDEGRREKKRKKWALALAQAWNAFAIEHAIAWGDDVDAWPIVVPGKWTMANVAGIATLIAEIAKDEAG